MNSFVPPRRILMGAGPSQIPSRVLNAAARPTVGHLDPSFVAMMEEVKDLLRYAFRTGNEVAFPVSAPGSAGMELCFVNLIEAGDKVVVCRNGVFGERMRENAVRLGAEAILVDSEWGRPVEIDKLADALAANPGVKAVAFVHAETSTGACRRCCSDRYYSHDEPGIGLAKAGDPRHEGNLTAPGRTQGVEGTRGIDPGKVGQNVQCRQQGVRNGQR